MPGRCGALGVQARAREQQHRDQEGERDVRRASCSDASHAYSRSRRTALTISAVNERRTEQAKSSTSSETTRATRAQGLHRSRNDSSGGRLRRTSRAGRRLGSRAVRGRGVDGSADLSCGVCHCCSGSLNAVTVPMSAAFRGSLAAQRAGSARARVHRPCAAGPRAARPRLPAEQLARERDVGPADLGSSVGQRLVDDLRARAGHSMTACGELEQRELVRVADVDRLVNAGLGEPDDPVDQVVDVAEGARLRSVAKDRDRPVLERLAHESRDARPSCGRIRGP